ncbi:hypothetical protein NFJ02_18g31940 [Pycnococcus provasolii]
MEKKLRRSPRFVNLPGGVRFVTAKQPGVPGLGLKYIGKDVLKAVVKKETLYTPKKFRRLMEWRGRVSRSEEETLDHLVNKGDVVRLAEDTILLQEVWTQLAAWVRGRKDCSLRRRTVEHPEQLKDLHLTSSSASDTGELHREEHGLGTAQISPPRVTREPPGAVRRGVGARARAPTVAAAVTVRDAASASSTNCFCFTQSGGGAALAGLLALTTFADSRRDGVDCHSTAILEAGASSTSFCAAQGDSGTPARCVERVSPRERGRGNRGFASGRGC